MSVDPGAAGCKRAERGQLESCPLCTQRGHRLDKLVCAATLPMESFLRHCGRSEQSFKDSPDLEIPPGVLGKQY